jgi:hypothetical protein
MPKLSERSALGGRTFDTDELHIVRSLASYRMALSSLFTHPRIPIRTTSGDIERVLFRKDPNGSTDGILQDGDILIYVDRGDERMIVGMALAEVSSFPTDLEDTSKFMRFIDTSALL